MKKLRIIQWTIIILTIGMILGVFIFSKNPTCIQNKKNNISSLLNEYSIKNKLWNKGFNLVSIKSSTDNNIQKAYFYSTSSNTPQPLLVSLHTWGGNYMEYDSLAILSQQKNINYIHPNFRGRNSKPESCLSNLVLSDIDDAIDYAIKNGNVDPKKIHVIGKSGGGYAALGAYMKSKHSLNSVSSWVPITDLVKWFQEGENRQNTFPSDILKCTSSKNGILDIKKAKERSPIFWLTPIEKRKNTKISIFAGINDGHNGSVPISHSILFFNKLVTDFSNSDNSELVNEQSKNQLLNRQTPKDTKQKIKGRAVFLVKKFQNIHLIIFEGGHEMLTEFAFNELDD